MKHAQLTDGHGGVLLLFILQQHQTVLSHWQGSDLPHAQITQMPWSHVKAFFQFGDIITLLMRRIASDNPTDDWCECPVGGIFLASEKYLTVSSRSALLPDCLMRADTA